MIQLKDMALTDFLCYEELAVDWRDFAGLSLIFAPNGSGKTALIDALSWALYGRTLRGALGKDVVRWGAERTRVQLRLAIDGDDVRIERSCSAVGKGRSTVKIKTNGEAVDQPADWLASKLQVTWQGFQHFVVHPQSGVSFMSSQPRIRLQILLELSGAEFWERAVKEARVQSKAEADAINELELTLATDRGKLDESHRALRQLQAMEKDAHSKGANAQSQADADVQGIKWKLRGQLDDLREQLRSDLEQYAAWLVKYGVGEDMAVSQEDAGLEMAKVTAERNRLQQQGENTKHIEVCPSCKRPWTKKQKNDMLKDIQLELDESNVAYNRARVLYKMAEFQEGHRKARWSMRMLCQKAGQAIIRRREQMKAETPDLTDLKARIKKGRSHVLSLQRGLTRRAKGLEKMEERASRLRRYIEVFTAIKAWAVNELVTEMERQTNHYLDELGFDEWIVEVESFSGYKTEIGVQVLTPRHHTAVPFELLSGGERKRIELATQLALTDIAREDRGWALAVFDEPASNLDDHGQLCLIETLRDRVAEGSVVVIEHNETMLGEYDAVVRVQDGQLSWG